MGHSSSQATNPVERDRATEKRTWRNEWCLKNEIEDVYKDLSNFNSEEDLLKLDFKELIDLSKNLNYYKRSKFRLAAKRPELIHKLKDCAELENWCKQNKLQDIYAKLKGASIIHPILLVTFTAEEIDEFCDDESIDLRNKQCTRLKQGIKAYSQLNEIYFFREPPEMEKKELTGKIEEFRKKIAKLDEEADNEIEKMHQKFSHQPEKVKKLNEWRGQLAIVRKMLVQETEKLAIFFSLLKHHIHNLRGKIKFFAEKRKKNKNEETDVGLKKVILETSDWLEERLEELNNKVNEGVKDYKEKGEDLMKKWNDLFGSRSQKLKDVISGMIQVAYMTVVPMIFNVIFKLLLGQIAAKFGFEAHFKTLCEAWNKLVPSKTSEEMWGKLVQSEKLDGVRNKLAADFLEFANFKGDFGSKSHCENSQQLTDHVKKMMECLMAANNDLKDSRDNLNSSNPKQVTDQLDFYVQQLEEHQALLKNVEVSCAECLEIVKQIWRVHPKKNLIF